MPTLTHFISVARMLVGALLLIALEVPAAQVLGGDEIGSGSLLSRNAQGEIEALPLLSTDVEIEITGPIARTVVTQHFHNPGGQWIEALYLFPLPQDAAVDRMRMQVGERIIEGQIQERAQAKATYEQAKREGRRAALVEQDRPNLFSTAVANIPPQGEVSVRIEYQQSLAWRDGEFSLRFPLAITPRYRAGLPEPEFLIEADSTLGDGWSILPGERPNRIPLGDAQPVERQVRIRARLDAGFELAEVKSHYHEITRSAGEGQAVEIRLKEASVPADRDFVLTWKPVPSQLPGAALFSEASEKGRFGLLMLTPPTLEGWQAPAREVIFVIDTSGSMAGQSIRAAREALLAGIDGLNAEDRFNIIEFNNDAAQLYNGAKPADRSHLAEARRYIQRLQADGGTNMAPALDLALAADGEGQRLRQVVFITDGAVSEEAALFAHIHRQLGDSRLFTVGIGSAPNSHFMAEAAVAGRGTFTYIATPDEAEASMKTLFAKLAQPALTHIEVESEVESEVEGDGITEPAPAVVPDLYAGEPLVLAMKLGSGANQLRLKGRIGDTQWQQTLQIESQDSRRGIGIDWARKTIAQWQRARSRGVTEEEIRQRILPLALEFHLVSPYTSLVAVDVTPVRPQTEDLAQKALPGQMPHGLEVKKLVPLAQGATGYLSTLLIGLLLLASALILTLRTRGDRTDGACPS